MSNLCSLREWRLGPSAPSVLCCCAGRTQRGTRIRWLGSRWRTGPQSAAGLTAFFGIAMPNVLLIDDDCSILAALRLIIESAGFAVVTAGNGVDALASIRTEAPDVIVADNMMPLMSGIDLWRFLASHRQYSSIPFIFQSAVHALPADVRPTAFLRKPYSPVRLISLLNEWTSHRPDPSGPSPDNRSSQT